MSVKSWLDSYSGDDKPEFIEAKHIEYLNDLRESGAVNMFGARSYLCDEFFIPKRDAGKILTFWMKHFGEWDNA